MSIDTGKLGLIDALWALDVTGKHPEDFNAPHDMRERIQGAQQLPPLPEMAQRVLALKSDPKADARKLAQIVELDPSLAGQVIRWSNSARYGFQSRILSVKDAITLALGYEQVFNLALALSAIRPFQVPVEGPLGKRFFWRQTLAGSALMQKLLYLSSLEARPDASALHLVYLLHNIGHLLLAHLFRAEFDYLRCSISANPDARLIALERYLLDVDHGQIGAWLMASWRMPELIQTVTLHHHNPYYRGEHQEMVWLTCLTDRLLGKIGIGDARNCSPTNSHLLNRLGMEPDKAEERLVEIEDALTELDEAVEALCGNEST
ncbi:HDOD domain-containing protein [Methyloterricola oryzae]|uniref:HDOD domain-containing protein n=1 Tax=Methyloterricola oryzae TaxID=1495050 RepID=UPI00069A4286|nr:HDOD domain-containing protein [Methyloterricola oryzae]